MRKEDWGLCPPARSKGQGLRPVLAMLAALRVAPGGPFPLVPPFLAGKAGVTFVTPAIKGQKDGEVRGRAGRLSQDLLN